MEPLVSFSHVTVSYLRQIALKDITIHIMPGEFVGIIGPNGGGKSTFLKALLGLVPITEGEIYLAQSPRLKSALKIGYVPQSTSFDRRFPISVLETVLTGRLPRQIKLFHTYSKQDKRLAYEQLERVGIKDLAKRQIMELSGGEFQRMLIARALCMMPDLLVLDEPTANVDTNSSSHIYQLLHQLNEQMTILLVTHDLRAVNTELSSLIYLNKTLKYHKKQEVEYCAGSTF